MGGVWIAALVRRLQNRMWDSSTVWWRAKALGSGIGNIIMRGCQDSLAGCSSTGWKEVVKESGKHHYKGEKGIAVLGG